MPYFANLGGYQQSASKVFKTGCGPGTAAPCSGIYRCETCGFEIVRGMGDALPAVDQCSEHCKEWRIIKGKVRWRLMAAPINTDGSS